MTHEQLADDQAEIARLKLRVEELEKELEEVRKEARIEYHVMQEREDAMIRDNLSYRYGYEDRCRAIAQIKNILKDF